MQQLLSIAQRAHAHSQKLQQPQVWQPAPGVPPPDTNSNQTPSIKDQYQQAQQAIDQWSGREDQLYSKMAQEPGFNPPPVQMQKENPWAVIGTALAALVSKGAAPGMLNQVATFQQQAEDQFQRDLQNQQLQGQIYDRNQANETRRLQAIQGIIADRERQRAEVLRTALARDKQDLAFNIAYEKHGEFAQDLALKWQHEGDWAANNAGHLAQQAVHDRNVLIAKGMSDQTATLIAEMRGNISVANARLAARTTSLKALLGHENAQNALKVRQQIAEAQNAQKAIAAYNAQISATMQKMGQPGQTPQQSAALKAYADKLAGERNSVEARVKKGLGDSLFSLAPVTDGISEDANEVLQSLNEEASYDPTTDQYMAVAQQAPVVVAPTFNVSGGAGGKSTTTQAPPQQEQQPPAPHAVATFTHAQAVKLARDHFGGNVQQAEQYLRAHGAIPSGQ